MSSVDLRHRSGDLEIMDDLDCSGSVVIQTLRELDVINQWLGGNAVTLSGVKKIMRLRPITPDDPLTVADLGCGSGDLLLRLARYGRQKGIPMQLTGIDANPHIVEYARKHCEAYREISVETTNVFSPDFAKRRFDIITGTLFFHHFDDSALVQLLPRLVLQSRLGLLINDIHRHPLAFHSIRLLTKLFSSSSMVRFDAPLSVRRAFTRTDWECLLSAGGITKYELSWKWAFRWKILVPAVKS